MRTRNKVFAAAGVLLVSSLVLTACGSKKDDGKTASTGSSAAAEENLQDTYSYVYTTDPNTFDYTVSSRTTNNDHLANFVDGLLDYDKYGNLQPALAESWKVSDDGLTYTYKLREGVQWVDNQGNEVAEVTANDFVTGLKHAADAKSETLYIVANSVKGLSDYVDGKITDFSQVGVKAVDDYTVEYTLNQPETFWNSKTTYGILYPVNEEFLTEKGDDFGQVSADAILYNGPFILSNFTSKSVIEYTKNESYWDKEHVYLDNVKLTFFDSDDVDSFYKGFDEGTYSQARIYPNSPAYADVQAKYGDDIIWSQPGGSTYNMTFNFNRGTFNATSKTTDKQKQDTQAAIRNKEFRQAIQFAFDKTTYRAQSVGEDGAAVALRNTLIPGTFLNIEGKPYGDTVTSELEALDPETFKGINLADGQDAYYNADKAKEVFAKAKEALQKENVEFPIHLDLPQDENGGPLLNQAKSLKKSIEDALGTDNVVIDLQLLNSDAYTNATYYAPDGKSGDFDIATASGWGPDFTDPSTYLNIYQSQTGDLLHTLGLENVANLGGAADPSADAKKAIGLDEYDKLLADADAIRTDADARYKAYAKAEAWLLDNVLQVPIYSDGGTPSLSKSIPFNKAYSWSGLSSSKFKNVKITDKAITTKDYEAALKKWQEEKDAIAEKEAE